MANGARVLRTPKRGLGRAYIDALPYIRGEYVLLGDADCTYDFRDIRGFVQAFRAGYEYIMGSRFRDYIAPGSMPALPRYLGTPNRLPGIFVLVNSFLTFSGTPPAHASALRTLPHRA